MIINLLIINLWRRQTDKAMMMLLVLKVLILIPSYSWSQNLVPVVPQNFIACSGHYTRSSCLQMAEEAIQKSDKAIKELESSYQSRNQQMASALRLRQTIQRNVYSNALYPEQVKKGKALLNELHAEIVTLREGIEETERKLYAAYHQKNMGHVFQDMAAKAGQSPGSTLSAETVNEYEQKLQRSDKLHDQMQHQLKELQEKRRGIYGFVDGESQHQARIEVGQSNPEDRRIWNEMRAQEGKINSQLEQKRTQIHKTIEQYIGAGKYKSDRIYTHDGHSLDLPRLSGKEGIKSFDAIPPTQYTGDHLSRPLVRDLIDGSPPRPVDTPISKAARFIREVGIPRTIDKRSHGVPLDKLLSKAPANESASPRAQRLNQTLGRLTTSATGTIARSIPWIPDLGLAVMMKEMHDDEERLKQIEGGDCPFRSEEEMKGVLVKTPEEQEEGILRCIFTVKDLPSWKTQFEKTVRDYRTKLYRHFNPTSVHCKADRDGVWQVDFLDQHGLYYELRFSENGHLSSILAQDQQSVGVIPSNQYVLAEFTKSQVPNNDKTKAGDLSEITTTTVEYAALPTQIVRRTEDGKVKIEQHAIKNEKIIENPREPFENFVQRLGCAKTRTYSDACKMSVEPIHFGGSNSFGSNLLGEHQANFLVQATESIMQIQFALDRKAIDETPFEVGFSSLENLCTDLKAKTIQEGRPQKIPTRPTNVPDFQKRNKGSGSVA